MSNRDFRARQTPALGLGGFGRRADHAARAVCLWAVVGVAGIACAPVAGVAPLLRANAGEREFGGSLTYGRGNVTDYLAKQERTESCFGPCFDNLPTAKTTLQRFTDTQGWFMYRGRGRVDGGALVFFGSSAVLGMGGILRWRLVDSEVFRLGLQLSGGWLWASAGLPVSIQVTRDIAVYAVPTAGAQASPLRLPVGVAVDVGDVVRMYVEGGAGTNAYYFGTAGIGFRY